MMTLILLILLPLLCQGLEKPFCQPDLQDKYCQAWYGGDLHTGCKYCGIGPQCPQDVPVSGRSFVNRPDLKEEILRRHNEYRADVRAGRTGLPATQCIPDLSWDDELAEVAQIWADQCANVIYFHNSDIYPRIFHERGFERTTSRFNSPPGVGQNVAWALTKHVNFTRIIDDLWYRDINKLQPGRIDDFRVDPSRMDTNLVTQILWGRTTHVGCGWTQFPLLEGSSKFEGIYADGEYENFFVCNYGVGGNVPGEPVYQMDCLENDDNKEVAKEMLDKMDIKFKERFTQASPQAKNDINICLDTLACLSQQSSGEKSCSQLEIQCVVETPPKFADTEAYFLSNSVDSRIAQLECKIEALLCSLPSNERNASSFSCGRNLERCIEESVVVDYDLTMMTMPESTSSRSSSTTLPTTTTTKKVVILVTSTTRPVVIQTSTEALMSGSTSLDIDEISTRMPPPLPQNEEVTTSSSIDFNMATPDKLETTTTSKTLPDNEPDDGQKRVSSTEKTSDETGDDNKGLTSSTTESTSLKKTTRLDDDGQEDRIVTTTTLRSNLLDFLASGLDTTTTRNEDTSLASISINSLIDMLMGNSTDIELLQETDFNVSFYNSTSKTSFRLAVCLDGIRCEDNARCKLVHTKCNQGMDVSMLPHRVRQKLSECSVDDILCHLSANPDVYECQRTFERCIKIVVPSAFIPMIFATTTAKPEDTTMASTELQDVTPTLDPVSILGGLASMTNKSNDVLSELTSNVLSAIQNTTDGFQIEPLTGNFSVADLLDSNDTLPIFQDFIILLNDTFNANETAIVMANDPDFGIDLKNATIIFNPSTFTIGDVKTILDPKLNETLRENIIEAVKNFAEVCNVCNSTTNDHDVVEQEQEVQDPQVALALCLKAVECEEPQTCERAQKLCLGEEIFINFETEQRQQLSECYVDFYICSLNGTKVCQLQNCLSEKVNDFQKKVFTVEDIISQVADDISDLVIAEEPEEQDDEKEITISGINEPISEEGTVSINLNDTKGPIILTSSTPIITFDEKNNTVKIKVEEKDLKGKKPDEVKEITKERIIEALRQIVVISKQPQPVQSQDPDEDSIGSVIANTVTEFINEHIEETPNEIMVNVETDKDLDVPEIEFGHTDNGTFQTTVKLPGQNDQSTRFPVAVPMKDDNVDVEALAEKISSGLDQVVSEPSLPDKLSNENDGSVSIADVISNTVSAYIEESQEESPDTIQVVIETSQDADQPEIQIEPLEDGSLKTSVKLPGINDQSVTISVPVPKSPKDGSLDKKKLAERISTSFDQSLTKSSTTPLPSTTAFLNKIEQDKVSIGEIIANTIGNYVEQSVDDPPKEVQITIETKKDLVNPEIEVKPADQVGALETSVKLPGDIDHSVTFKTSVPLNPDGEFVDVDNLAKEIGSEFDKKISPKDDLTQDIIDKIEDHLVSIKPSNNNKVIVKIEPTENAEKTAISVQGTDTLEIDAQVPGRGGPLQIEIDIDEDFNVNEIAEKASQIVKTQINDGTQESTSEIATILADVVKGLIDDEEKENPPSNVQLNIKFDDKMDVPGIEEITRKDGTVVAIMTVPGDKDEPDQVIAIPIKTDEASKVDKEQLIEDFAQTIEPIMPRQSAKENVQKVAGDIADAIIKTITERPLEKATIQMSDNDQVTIEIEETQRPITRTTTLRPVKSSTILPNLDKIEVEIPRVNGSTEIDKPTLVNIIEDKLKDEVQSTTPKDFIMSIDKFGLTIATLATTEVILTTERSTTVADSIEATTESMNDFMSVSEFGFTISAPVNEDLQTPANPTPEVIKDNVEKGKVETLETASSSSTPRALFSSTPKITPPQLVDASSSESSVNRPEVANPSENAVDFDKIIRPSTTLRSLEITSQKQDSVSVLPSVEVSPPYTSVTTNEETTEKANLNPQEVTELKEVIVNKIEKHLQDEAAANIDKAVVKIQPTKAATKPEITVKGIGQLEIDAKVPGKGDKIEVELSIDGAIDVDEVAEKASVAIKQKEDDLQVAAKEGLKNEIAGKVQDQLEKSVPNDKTNVAIKVQPTKAVTKPEVSVQGSDKLEINAKVPGKGDVKEVEIQIDGDLNIDEIADKASTVIQQEEMDQQVSSKNELKQDIAEKVQNQIDKQPPTDKSNVNLKIQPTKAATKTEITVQGTDKLEIKAKIPGDGDATEVDIPIEDDLDVADIAERVSTTVKEAEIENQEAEKEGLKNVINEQVQEQLAKSPPSDISTIVVKVKPTKAATKPEVTVQGTEKLEISAKIPGEGIEKEVEVQIEGDLDVTEVAEKASTVIKQEEVDLQESAKEGLKTEISEKVQDQIDKMTPLDMSSIVIKVQPTKGATKPEIIVQGNERLEIQAKVPGEGDPREEEIPTAGKFNIGEIAEKASTVIKQEEISQQVAAKDGLKKDIADKVQDQLGKLPPSDKNSVVVKVQPTKAATKPEVTIMGTDKLEIDAKVPGDGEEIEEEFFIQGDFNVDDIAEKASTIIKQVEVEQQTAKKDTLMNDIASKVQDQLDKVLPLDKSSVVVKVQPTKGATKPEITVKGSDKLEIDAKVPGEGITAEIEIPTDGDLNVSDIAEKASTVIKQEEIDQQTSEKDALRQEISDQIQDQLDKLPPSDKSTVVVKVQPSKAVTKPEVTIQATDKLEIDAKVPGEGATKEEEIPFESVSDISEKASTVIKQEEIEQKEKAKDGLQQQLTEKIQQKLDKLEPSDKSSVSVKVQPSKAVVEPEITIHGTDKLAIDAKVPGEGEETDVELPLDGIFNVEDIVEKTSTIIKEQEIENQASAKDGLKKEIADLVQDQLDKLSPIDKSSVAVNVQPTKAATKPEITVKGTDKLEIEVKVPGEGEKIEEEFSVQDDFSVENIAEKASTVIKQVEIEQKIVEKDGLVKDISSKVQDQLDKLPPPDKSSVIVKVQPSRAATKPEITVVGTDKLEIDAKVPGQGEEKRVEIPVNGDLNVSDIAEKASTIIKQEEIDEQAAAKDELKEEITDKIQDQLDRLPPSDKNSVIVNVKPTKAATKPEITVQETDKLVIDAKVPGEGIQKEVELPVDANFDISDIAEKASTIIKQEEFDQQVAEKDGLKQDIATKIQDQLEKLPPSDNSSVIVKVQPIKTATKPEVIVQGTGKLEIDVTIPGEGDEKQVELPLQDGDLDIADIAEKASTVIKQEEIDQQVAAKDGLKQEIAEKIQDQLDKSPPSDKGSIVVTVKSSKTANKLEIEVQAPEKLEIEAKVPGTGDHEEVVEVPVGSQFNISDIAEKASTIIKQAEFDQADQDDLVIEITEKIVDHLKTVAPSEKGKAIVKIKLTAEFTDKPVVTVRGSDTLEIDAKVSGQGENVEIEIAIDDEFNAKDIAEKASSAIRKVQSQIKETSTRKSTTSSTFTPSQDPSSTTSRTIFDTSDSNIIGDDKLAELSTIATITRSSTLGTVSTESTTPFSSTTEEVKNVVRPLQIDEKEVTAPPKSTVTIDLTFTSDASSSTPRTTSAITQGVKVVDPVDKDKSVTVTTSATSSPPLSILTTVDPVKTSSETTTVKSETTTEASSIFGSGILQRVRDLAIALLAGLIAQNVGLPSLVPARKDDKEGIVVPVPTRPPFFNAKDPFIRNKVKGGEGQFNGSTFSLTIPVKPEEVDDLKKDEIRNNISNVVKEAFGSSVDDPVNNITVIFAEPSEDEGKIIINAPYDPDKIGQRPTTSSTTSEPILDDRPKLPRFDDQPDFQIPPVIRYPSTTERLPIIRPEVSRDPTISEVRRPPTQRTSTSRPVFTTSRFDPVVTTDRRGVKFELDDAIVTPRPLPPNAPVYPTLRETSTTEPPPFYDYPIDDNILPVLPTDIKPAVPINDDILDQYIPSVIVDENRVFDRRLNFLGGSSANVVEATVVEDLNYARSIRDSRASTIGIATISSITVGVIALLAFGLLIFMALARRRRRQYDTATAASSANLTPTQSRTTFSGTPVMADTPSVSGGFADDPLNTTGSSTIDPVIPIDGHQTIISSYHDFMAIPNESRSNIMNSLPSPQSSEGAPHQPTSISSAGNPPSSLPTSGVARTRDLVENSPFLFAPNPAGPHYH